MNGLALATWPRLGARGAYIRLYGQQGLVDAYVLEIAPGGRTLPERHVFEEYLYVLQGHGRTRLWQGERADAVEVAWGPGAVLSPPLNAGHEHLNTGDEPVRLVGITNAPLVLDLYRDPRFVFENPLPFLDRWDGSAAFFEAVPVPRGPHASKPNARHAIAVNRIPDVRDVQELMFHWKRKNAWFVSFEMAGNTLNPHVSRWAPRSYQAAHRHGPGSTLLIVQGKGFALMWPREAGTQPYANGHGDRVIRTELTPGTLYAPPHGWYHTHFNTGDGDALYLAITPRGREYHVRAFPQPGHAPEIEAIEEPLLADRPHLIPREREDPGIRRLHDEALRRRGSAGRDR